MIRDFQDSINDSRQLRFLYHHCAEELRLPGEYSDLLRMSVVYCMSAFDKLIHDMVIYGMVETFAGRRQGTLTYLKESISLENHLELMSCSVPPPEIIFKDIVQRKLSHQSFMDPSKLAAALSLIWSENHKWQVIADAMGRNQKQVAKELRNIYQRRNAIVHETDKNPSTSQKMPILTVDSERIESFILELGETIYRLVM
ncbi:MAG: hypothetical protein D3916_17280 [Candidatus Electrothrix sp. MAN1_4]|nr:hypothetical protein [Candidatus Electrothrix sp. MAN1_4]